MKKINTLKNKQKINLFGRKVSSVIRKRNNTKGICFLPRRKNPWKTKKQAKSVFIRITAPAALSLSLIGKDKKYYDQTIKFIEKLKETVKSHSKNVMVCFQNSWSIDAMAAIYLYAEIDRLVKQNPTTRFRTSYPTIKKTPSGEVALIHPVLNRLGIYQLLGGKKLHLHESSTVRCWNIAESDKVDMELANNIVENTLRTVTSDSKNYSMPPDIYRALSEAIGNATEHAYSDKIKSNANLSDKRHWFLSAVQDDKLLIIVCDLGHGIPATLGCTESTQDKSILDFIFSLIDEEDEEWKKTNKKIEKQDNNNHAKRIRAAMMVKETRTKLKYRGKGGKDIKHIVNENKDAQVMIVSLKGMYIYRSKSIWKRNKTIERRHGIDGTVVGWSLPISGDKNDD